MRPGRRMELPLARGAMRPPGGLPRGAGELADEGGEAAIECAGGDRRAADSAEMAAAAGGQAQDVLRAPASIFSYPGHRWPVRADGYGEQLREKEARTLAQFGLRPLGEGQGGGASAVGGVELEVAASPPVNFRQRVRFAVVRIGGRVRFAMFNGGDPAFIISEADGFPVASTRINAAMPPTLELLQGNAPLQEGLRACNFLSTLRGGLLVTLFYDAPLRGDWEAGAHELRARLGACGVAGRSKGELRSAGELFVTEELALADGRRLVYKQVEGSFSNPNSAVSLRSVDWLCSVVRGLEKTGGAEGDLLELYCGNGNHTCALAAHFRKVLGVEINEHLVTLGNENLHANGVRNAKIVRSPSERFCRKIMKRKAFRDAGEGGLGDFAFGTVLVDPPRAGLDVTTLRLVREFRSVLYISCNPDTLQDALEALAPTHSLKRFVLLDHFPYTEMRECGVHLVRRPGSVGPGGAGARQGTPED